MGYKLDGCLWLGGVEWLENISEYEKLFCARKSENYDEKQFKITVQNSSKLQYIKVKTTVRKSLILQYKKL